MKTEDVAKVIINRPARCIAIMLVLTLVFCSGLVNFSVSMDLEDMFPDSQEVDDQELIRNEFFNDEMATVVTKGCSVLSPTYFRKIGDVIEAWLKDTNIREALIGETSETIMCIPITLSRYGLMLKGNPRPTTPALVLGAASALTLWRKRQPKCARKF